ncbi:F0F1 ATP synthase subunit A, partial [Candidatus Woesebacteria bacterium]|nr:F0F1 ATP synthase subunit A [Candidatus Woesebacteria bacterium]
YYYSQITKKDRSLAFYGLHGFIVGIQGMLTSVLGKKIDIFFPLLGSFFFFILLMNWSGLIPGVGSLMIKVPNEEVKEVVVESNEGHADEASASALVEESAKEDSHDYHKIPLLRGGTADLNTTLALALITVFATQMYGLRFLGLSDHFKKYINLKDPMSFFLGPLEIVQEFARIISFGFRLYGNIFAGEVLLTIIPFLLPIFFSWIVAPIFFLEVFVGVVQALVFVMFSAVFINMAVAKHH